MYKRLFIAVKIKPSTQLLSICRKLQQELHVDQIKWVIEKNLHITLKFLGEVDEQLLPGIIIALKTVAKESSPFEILIKGIGKFSKKKHAKVIYLGIEDQTKGLFTVFTSLHNIFRALGFKTEQKPFKAHLTLGRIKHIRDEHVLDSFINAYSAQEFQKNTVEEIILFESILKSKGPVYRPLKKIKIEN